MTQPTPAEIQSEIIDRAEATRERDAAMQAMTSEVSRLTRALRQAQDALDAEQLAHIRTTSELVEERIALHNSEACRETVNRLADEEREKLDAVSDEMTRKFSQEQRQRIYARFLYLRREPSIESRGVRVPRRHALWIAVGIETDNRRDPDPTGEIADSMEHAERG